VPEKKEQKNRVHVDLAADDLTTLSWWESLDDVRGFAGEDIGQAVFYPEDDEYLIDRETTVTHHEVARRRD
jgi:hypothetical protein